MPTIAFTDILYTDNELIKHFKDQFTVDKTYLYYQREITRGCMCHNETVGNFYDRIRILINGTQIVLKDKYGKITNESIKPLADSAIDTFIRGLPDLETVIDTRMPSEFIFLSFLSGYQAINLIHTYNPPYLPSHFL